MSTKTEGTLCMFCVGENGNHVANQECAFKNAVMIGLMQSLAPHEAMLILDRTPFLANAAAQYRKTKET